MVTVDVLDQVTLQRLQSLNFPVEMPVYLEALAFSPDSRTLASFIRNDDPDTGGSLITWDLRAGSVVSAIGWTGPRDTKAGNASITYWRGDRMVAVLSRYTSSIIISIYDVVSGVHLNDVDHGVYMNVGLDLGVMYVYNDRTHEESLRFATPGETTIGIWEVKLAPGARPTLVEILQIPAYAPLTLDSDLRAQGGTTRVGFHFSTRRLALIRTGIGGELQVWGNGASKLLLHHAGIDSFRSMAFSADGSFFVCITAESVVYVWKGSSISYTLYETLTTDARCSELRFSPNSESIIAFGDSVIQLWHTKDFDPTTPITPTKPQPIGNFLLEFFPDGQSAVAARKLEKTATVLNFESKYDPGYTGFTVDTSLEIYGLRTIGNAIVVVGDQKAIAWNPPESYFPGARMSMGVDGSTSTIDFGNADKSTVVAASISLDFQNIALAKYDAAGSYLGIHYTSTGQEVIEDAEAHAVWFTPGGDHVGCAIDKGAKVFEITPDGLHNIETVADIEDASWGCPWVSSLGYRVTSDGWILGAGGKRLLMLPPLWRSPSKVDRVWNGKFVALLHGGLPEPIILELEP